MKGGENIKSKRTKRLGTIYLVFVLMFSAFSVMSGFTVSTGEGDELFEENDLQIEEEPKDGQEYVEIEGMNITLRVNITHSEWERMNVTFYNSATGEEIGNVSYIDSGDEGNVTWEELKYGTRYTWNVNVTEADDEDVNWTESETWTFETERIPNIPEALTPSPGNEDVGIYPGMNTTLEVNVTHPEGKSMNVTFYNGDGSEIDNKTEVEDCEVNVTWEGLRFGTSYEWYVNVTEYQEENNYTVSETWTFTTEEVITDMRPSPVEPRVEIEGMNTTLGVNVSHPDDEDMNVTFYGNQTNKALVWLHDETISDGEWANYTWENLTYGTEYTWHVNITYGEEDKVLIRSDNWTFTTEDILWKIGEPNNPGIGAENVSINPELNVTATHPKCEDVNVTFYGREENAGAEEWELLHNETIESGNYTTYIWEGLDYNTTYEWYVNVSETQEVFNSTDSEVWNFTTEETPMYELALNITGEGSITVEWDNEEENVTDDETSDGPWILEFEENKEVTLTAEAEDGWFFNNWTGDHPEDGSEMEDITIEMGENKSLTANFIEEDVEYELKINIDGEGKVEVDGVEFEDGDSEMYEEGSEVTLKAIPEEGWKFEEWEGTDETGEEITLTIDEDKEITASFGQPYFEVKIIEYDEEVEAGRYIMVEYTIENTGNLKDTQDITFLVEGSAEDIENDVTLEPGEKRTGKFFWQAEVGSHLLTVESEDDRDRVSVYVYMEEPEPTPGFTSILLILAAVFAVVVYHKKKR